MSYGICIRVLIQSMHRVTILNILQLKKKKRYNILVDDTQISSNSILDLYI